MFKSPAPVLEKRAVHALLMQKQGCRVIEVGAGCLRNSLFLLEKKFKVTVLEVPGMDTRFPENFAMFRRLGGTFTSDLPKSRRFELALATFVFETICDRKLRAKIVRGVFESLNHSGCLVLSARGPGDLVTAHEKGRHCSDGFLTPGYSFARSYTRVQLQRMLSRGGFRKVEFLHRDGTTSPELLHAIAWR
jgi:hypothetical protein